jgi:putative alpha-1,2-mannosidase
MSSWMVLSAMGIFPVAPGTDTWGLNAPAFDRVELTLDRDFYPEGHFTIRAPRGDDADRYIRSASADGRDISRTWISTDDIRRGRSLNFRLGTEPARWGTGEHDAPPPLGRAGERDR